MQTCPSLQTTVLKRETDVSPVISWRYAALLWLVSAAILVVLNQYRNGPATLADELGYLGVARWLAGAGPLPNMFTASFYHFGYSFLIAPAYWLGSNPVDVYKWVMVINCTMAATVAPLSYAFARKLFTVNHKQALFLTTVAMIYPANAVQTNFAWSENALPALMLCWSMLLLIVHEQWSPTKVVALALIPVLLFFVHPRMLGIELVTFAYLATASAMCKKGKLWYIISCGVMIAAHVLVAYTLSHIRHLAYAPGHGNVTNFMHLLDHIGPQSMKVMAAASGQIAYLSYGSEGLIVIGVMGLILFSWWQYHAIREEHSILNSFLLNPYVILTAGIASVLAASAITMSQGARTDHWLYGRYIDATSPILLIVGTTMALDAKRIRQLAPWLVMSLCFGITLWFSYATISRPQDIVYNNIPTLAPLIQNLQHFARSQNIEFAVVMLLVLTPALLFAAAGKRAVKPIIAVYLLLSITTIVEWPRHLVGHNAYPTSVREARSELASSGLEGSKILVYRDSFTDPSFVAMFYRMQYFLETNPVLISGNGTVPESCPRVGTLKDLESGPGAARKPIHVATNVIFWVPQTPKGAAPCN